GKRTLILDFSEIEYMNSSTFSPLVKMLDEAARRGVPVRVIYSQTQKWQALSFSALKAFETRDGKISIRAR
ncbi:MAG: STAS domain-containing protein, partial [Myxococcaceae bacterium]